MILYSFLAIKFELLTNKTHLLAAHFSPLRGFLATVLLGLVGTVTSDSNQLFDFITSLTIMLSHAF